jgi:hypothetical protein
MNEAVLHLVVRNQNGVQLESHSRSEYVALQKQAADFTDTIHIISQALDSTTHHTQSYAFLRLKVQISSFIHIQVIYRRYHKGP